MLASSAAKRSPTCGGRSLQNPQGGMSIDTEGRDEVKAAFKYKRCRKWI